MPAALARVGLLGRDGCAARREVYEAAAKKPLLHEPWHKDVQRGNWVGGYIAISHNVQIVQCASQVGAVALIHA